MAHSIFIHLVLFLFKQRGLRKGRAKTENVKTYENEKATMLRELLLTGRTKQSLARSWKANTLSKEGKRVRQGAVGAGLN